MKITVNVDPTIIANMLLVAFATGSRSWVSVERVVEPLKRHRVAHLDGKRFFPVVDSALCVGGQIKLSDARVELAKAKQSRGVLNPRTVAKGLRLMARDAPVQFGAMLAGQGDADTADILLQYCVFGRLIYG